MATDPRKRQKKLARLAARRKEKRHEHIREQQAGIAGQMAAAARYPILHCWVMENLWSNGMGQVLLSRELPGGRVAVSVFLVDRYCLGVKNAFAVVVGRFSYDSKFTRETRSQFATEDFPPVAARKLVEGAVAYAQSLGFPPHPDYHKAKLIFGDIDAGECLQEFEFGKDGKPIFIAGPHDGPQRCKAIIAQLERKLGQDDFQYLVPVSGADDIAALEEGLPGEARPIGPDETGEIREWLDDIDDDEE